MVIGTLALTLLLAAPSPEEPRFLRFIGNSGFEISDGSSVILVDFPYKSGAYGYMTFEPAEVHKRSNSLCLFTHAHADHFSPKDLSEIGCRAAGPSEVLARIDASQQLGGKSPWTFGSASISCIQSEHGNVEHCSYILNWHDTAILVSGDIESVTTLINQVRQADLVILPYWLSDQSAEIRRRFPKAKIVLSHQKPGEQLDPCDGCERPRQGDSIAW